MRGSSGGRKPIKGIRRSEASRAVEAVALDEDPALIETPFVQMSS